MIALSVTAFGIAWWLGLYLIARDPRKPVLLLTGIGLLSYALGLASRQLGLTGGQPVLLAVPGLAWTAVLGLLAPTASPIPTMLRRVWTWVLVPLALIAAALTGRLPGAGIVTAILVIAPLGVALWLLARRRRLLNPAPARGLLVVASLFFVLSCAAVLPIDALPPGWHGALIAAMGLDLALLALAVAALDAFDEAQALRVDMVRSLLAATAAAVLFGGQVGLAMIVVDAEGPPLSLVAVLFGVVAAAITVTVLARQLQAMLDRLALPARMRGERAELREVADALPRRRADGSGAAELLGYDDAEFARLTRRALSHYGDLAKLVTSPLTRLAVIDHRLAARSAADRPLERAAELKAVLGEAIEALRPRTDTVVTGDIGTSDEWRYYNALYYPYVVGIRPYRQFARRDGLTPATRRAFDYLATHVPERTLHNWQNAAARLVATQMRARERELAADGSATSGRGSSS